MKESIGYDDLRIGILTNQYVEYFDFLMNEDDITKLFLMRLIAYCDKYLGVVFEDKLRSKEMIKVIHYASVIDLLQYKIDLTTDIKKACKIANNIRNINDFNRYKTALLNIADYKCKKYSVLDDRLFCYFTWCHLVDDSEKDKDGWLKKDSPYLISHEHFFKNKLSMFHEQRKLIVIFELERNINNPLNINNIKDKWRKICRHGCIINLDKANSKFVEWVFNYVVNFIEERCLKNNNKLDDLFYLQIVTIEDKIETCYTLMHHYIYRDEKLLQLFTNKIRLAISQQNRRDNVKKSQFSIKLDKEYDEKLKMIAKYRNKPKRQLLKEMLDQEYEDVTNIAQDKY